MSRLRIRDRRSIRNLMAQDRATSRLVRELDIAVRDEVVQGDRMRVELRESTRSAADRPPSGSGEVSRTERRDPPELSDPTPPSADS
jgi:hypothetical protein